MDGESTYGSGEIGLSLMMPTCVNFPDGASGAAGPQMVGGADEDRKFPATLPWHRPVNLSSCEEVEPLIKVERRRGLAKCHVISNGRRSEKLPRSLLSSGG